LSYERLESRKRSIPFGGLHSTKLKKRVLAPWGETVTTTLADNLAVSRKLVWTQTTASINHGDSWRTRKQGAFTSDIGGPFSSTRNYVVSPLDDYRELFVKLENDPTLGSVTYLNYWGSILPTADILVGSTPWPPNVPLTDSELDALGSTAIARCKPANNIASLAESLLELRREGLPKLVGSTLWKAQTMAARRKAAGSEYLNVEFGYKPLAKDIADSAFVISEADRLIKQYKRDAGKRVRRSYRFPPTIVESTVVIDDTASPAMIGTSNLGFFDINRLNMGKVYRHRKMEKSVWFSGSFTYHLPIDPITMGNVGGRSGALQKLLGLELTPETIWNLAPWSWAVDWVSNTGDIISNLQSWTRDGMVLAYGYVMAHTKCTDTYYFVGDTGLRQKHVRPCIIQLVSETKQRRAATPFGFGLKDGDFSLRQKAIIAALGLSRGK